MSVQQELNKAIHAMDKALDKLPDGHPCKGDLRKCKLNLEDIEYDIRQTDKEIHKEVDNDL